jgi:hypothetical protein
LLHEQLLSPCLNHKEGRYVHNINWIETFYLFLNHFWKQ